MDTTNSFLNHVDLQHKDCSIFVAGHNGMVGSSIVKNLKSHGFNKIITADRANLNLLNQTHVLDFFSDNKIDQIYIAAARVGGIYANSTYPADFIYENLMIEANLIHAAHVYDIDRLMFLGSSCIYPRNTSQPMKENQLLTGELEKTNQAYAISKIAGIELCRNYNNQFSRDFRCVMPTNLYGRNDNFHSENSHVIPGLISRFYEAKKNNFNKIKIWGTGEAYREFLHVQDLAQACIFLMNLSKEKFYPSLKSLYPFVNIGSGLEIRIKDLVDMISNVSNFNGDLVFDITKPDGPKRKLLDNSVMNKFGWEPKISLQDGIRDTYEWYSNNQTSVRNKK